MLPLNLLNSAILTALFLQLLIVADNWKVATNLILLMICLYVCVKYCRARQQWPLYLYYLVFSMVGNTVCLAFHFLGVGKLWWLNAWSCPLKLVRDKIPNLYKCFFFALWNYAGIFWSQLLTWSVPVLPFPFLCKDCWMILMILLPYLWIAFKGLHQKVT